MRRANFTNTFNRQTERGGKNAKGNNDGCDRLRFSVAVRMRFVGRTCREFQASPNDQRAGDIEGGFDAVGDEDVCVANETAENFRGCENQVYDHTEQSDARASLQIARGGFACRMIVHAEGND